MEYKTIPFNPDYKVSKCGTSVIRISIERELVQGDQIVKGEPTGYKYVTLYFTIKAYECKRIAVHRLVCWTWHGPPPEGKPWVNHDDGIRSHNHADNLAWSTISENIQHSFDVLGRKVPSGPEHYMFGKTPSKETKRLMRMCKLGKRHPKYKGYYQILGRRFYSSRVAGEVMNVSDRTIQRRCRNSRFIDYSFVLDPDKTG